MVAVEADVEADDADEELDEDNADMDMGIALAVGEEGAWVPIEAEDWELNKLSRSEDGLELTDSVDEGARSLKGRWLQGGKVYLGQFGDSWVVDDKCSEWWSLTTAACR